MIGSKVSQVRDVLVLDFVLRLSRLGICQGSSDGVGVYTLLTKPAELDIRVCQLGSLFLD